MRVTSDLIPRTARGQGPVLVLYAWPDADDQAAADKRGSEMGRNGAYFALPPSFHTIHPDLYALAVLCVFQPYTGASLQLDAPVSRGMAELVARHLGIDLGPDSRDVERREPGNGKDAVAFSGGLDSSAALHLAPAGTAAVFLNRTAPRIAKESLYRPDAAWRTLAALRRRRFPVFTIDTDMEYVRKPVGFPVDVANAVPCILLAASLEFRSVGFGHVASWVYDTDGVRYRPVTEHPELAPWMPLFDYVRLPIAMLTGSLTEVGTARVAADVSSWHPQSCIRGSASTPCGTCTKCFRKRLLEAALAGRSIDDDHFERNLSSREVRLRLSARPIHMENVLAWSLDRMPPSTHPMYTALRDVTDHVLSYGQGLHMMPHYYPKGLQLVPDHLRDGLRRRIQHFVPPMSDEEIAIMERWDLSELAKEPSYIAAHERLDEMFLVG